MTTKLIMLLSAEETQQQEWLSLKAVGGTKCLLEEAVCKLGLRGQKSGCSWS